ncbi:minor capsid protein [Weizmannia sp. FSL W8-1119]|uniref:phage head morphogenesis protein n=1 Tax=Weizmannia sp. FSL W8-1119 TaxID=2954709 RepID=UPI0030F62463
MAKTVPQTRYPHAAEAAYFRDIQRLVTELGKVTLQVFDEQIKPQIKLYGQDSYGYIMDGPLDVIQRAIEIIKGLSLGIFASTEIRNICTRFLNAVNAQSKANIQQQARIIGIDPTQSEPWLDEFMRSSINENVSYISTIRDEFFPKIEGIIYQGVKNGSSIKSIRDQLVERIGMTKNRAQFIAVDQTGSIFGQMTAKRHQEMGVEKFKWSTSHDDRVRQAHRVLDGRVFAYSDPPSEGLPGTPYRCRCVAIPVFDDGQVKINQPNFLRVQTNGIDSPDDLKAIQDDLSMVPEEHHKILRDTVKEIKLINDPPSFFHRASAKIKIYP